MVNPLLAPVLGADGACAVVACSRSVMRAMRKRMAMTTAMTVPKAVQLFGQRFVVGVVQLQG